MFVHKVLFTLQDHVKTTKTDKHAFSLLKKDELGAQQTIVTPVSHFNQPNIERKNCVGTTKYKGLLEMCIVQQIEMKSVFTIQPIK